MGIIRTTITDFKEDVHEGSMIAACRQLYDAGYFKFDNFYYCYEYEADLFVVSKARYATEIEVKCSVADWKNDLRKQKHGRLSKYIKHFYFAVPSHLIDKQPEGFDERYGLIEIYHDKEGRLRPRIIKAAGVLNTLKLHPNIYCKAFKSTYYRYGDLAQNSRNIQRDYHDLQRRYRDLVNAEKVV